MPGRLEMLLQFYEEDPTDAFTRFALASEYLKGGNIAEGLAFFEQLVADDPGYIGTYYHLGKLYETLGKTEQAINTYRDGIAIAQAQHEAHARAELQSALLEAQGLGFDDD